MARYKWLRVVSFWVALMWLVAMYQLTSRLDSDNLLVKQQINFNRSRVIRKDNQAKYIPEEHHQPTIAKTILYPSGTEGHFPEVQYQVSSRNVERTWLEFWRYVHSKLTGLGSLLSMDPDVVARLKTVIAKTSTFVSEPQMFSMGLTQTIDWTGERLSRTQAWNDIKKLLTSLKSNQDTHVSKFVETFLENNETISRILEDDYKIISKNVTIDEGKRRHGLASITHIVQSRLHQLQNPQNCSGIRHLYCKASQLCGTGFGCLLNHVASCLIAGYATNRTVYFQRKPPADIYANHLQSINTRCQPMFTSSSTNWLGLSKTELEAIPTIQMESLSLSTPTPEFAPFAIPKDLAHQITRYHGDASAWWIGQILRFSIKPMADIEERLKEFIEKRNLSRPFIGIHVRRTDKVAQKEAGLHQLDEYMTHAKAWFAAYEEYNPTGKSGTVIRRVLLCTDDPNVLKEATLKYPDFTFVSDQVVVSAAMNPSTRLNQASLYGIIKDILLLASSDYIVCTFSSNVCRAAYALMQTRYSDMSARFRSLDDRFYFSGQRRDIWRAVTNHTAETVQEIDLRVGDSIGYYGNHWDGFSKGENLRTQKTGLFPTYKVIREMIPVDMPIYEQTGILNDPSAHIKGDVILNKKIEMFFWRI